MGRSPHLLAAGDMSRDGGNSDLIFLSGEKWWLRTTGLKPLEAMNGVIPVADLVRELWACSTQGRKDDDRKWDDRMKCRQLWFPCPD